MKRVGGGPFRSHPTPAEVQRWVAAEMERAAAWRAEYGIHLELAALTAAVRATTLGLRALTVLAERGLVRLR